MGRNTVAIPMTVPFRILLITVKVVALEEVSSSDTQNLRLFLNALTVDEKHYLLTRENLTKTIRTKLSQKQKTFCQFFLYSENLN